MIRRSRVLLFARIIRLTGLEITTYTEGDRARRGDSGALYLQSAIAGLNSCSRLLIQERVRASGVEGRVPRNRNL